jgi:phage-related protein (TIGR01555 family)
VASKHRKPSSAALDALFKQHRAQAKKASKTSAVQEVTPSMSLAAMLGVQDKDVAASLARAMDMFSNPAARTGYGNPNLIESTEYPLVRTTFNYTLLYTLYESSWIARRVVDTPASDMCRAWPKLTSDIEPKELSKIDRVLRKTNTRNNLLTAMKWARLFGGAGALMVIDGQEHELDKPLDLDEVPLGSFRGVIPFDRWSGIYPGVKTCQDIQRPVDFNLPETYKVQGAGGGQSFEVHASRVLRFTGPTVPTPEREAYSFWGISVIEPVLQELKKRDNVSANIAALTFRANILGMKFPELAALLSGLGMPGNAGTQFEQRMSQLNHLISNQSLVPLPENGGIESTQYSFSGLGEVYQQFCLDISGAAQIPVARLWGRTITGLGQTGDGDEKIYCERIATDQDTDLRPQLEKLYPVLCASELGEVPDDLDLNFPSLAVPDDKEKAELAKSVADVVTVAMNGGIISPRTAAKELKQSSDKTGIFTNITPEDIEKLSDEVSSEGELGEGLFGEAGGGLSPSSGPGKVIKEENKVGKATQEPADAPTDHQAPPRGALGEGEEGLKRLAAKANDADGPGPTVYVHGLECVIETPKGEVRSGKGWEITLPYSYGYVKGVQGADGDSMDVALGTGPDNGWAYLIDQRHLGKPGFDETKCFLQWPSATAALNAYKAGHHRWEEVMMDWTPMPIDSFKEWLKNGDHSKPVGGASK